MNKWFCFHRWEVSSATYSPAKSGKLEVDNANSMKTEHLQIILYGMTVVVQECYKCGQLKNHTTPGKFDPL